MATSSIFQALIPEWNFPYLGIDAHNDPDLLMSLAFILRLIACTETSRIVSVGTEEGLHGSLNRESRLRGVLLLCFDTRRDGRGLAGRCGLRGQNP